MMSNFEILNNVDHKDLRVVQGNPTTHGEGVHCCPAYTFEFRDLQNDFPLLLQEHSEGGFIPVALMGFEAGENLFIEGDAWLVPTPPAYIRKGPFLIGTHKTEASELVRMMSVDTSHPRVSWDQGTALFQPLGGRTDYLEQTANLLETIFESAEHTKRFTAALDSLALIESITLDITLNDGSKNQLLGFYTVNEDMLKQLSAEQLSALSGEGFLMPLFMMLASLSNFTAMIKRKDQRL